MLKVQIPPHASDIFRYGLSLDGVNLISLDKEQLMLTLLPRTTGKFTRSGLIVNNVRYKNKDFAEKYLSGGNVTVAYNPEDSENVWLIDKGNYIKFELIESRFRNKNFEQIEKMQIQRKSIVNSATGENLQARINLASYIETIVNNTRRSNGDLNEILQNKEREKRKSHVDYMAKVGVANE